MNVCTYMIMIIRTIRIIIMMVGGRGWFDNINFCLCETNIQPPQLTYQNGTWRQKINTESLNWESHSYIGKPTALFCVYDFVFSDTYPAVVKAAFANISLAAMQLINTIVPFQFSIVSCFAYKSSLLLFWRKSQNKANGLHL